MKFLFSQPCPRRKSLTGQFYGVDFKLAPVPAAADPRSSLATRSAKSKGHSG